LEQQTGLLSRSVAGGTPAYVFHPVLLRYLRTEFRRQDLAGYARALGAAPVGAAPPAAAGPLTPKEQEILQELPHHQTIRDIAARQRVSPNTVKTHLRVLYQKLGVRNRTAAVEKAVEQGLL
jgi:DNA-binding NarL/FixJ family response regulator